MRMAAKKEANRYVQILEKIFQNHYRQDLRKIAFDRTELSTVAHELGIALPKNLGDIIYSFRYRAQLPESIIDKAPEGSTWIIRPAGRGRYEFALVTQAIVSPSKMLVETKIPDATPGVISKYALNDEQALLARLRYNRLVDIFTGLACYSLQNHLRTTLPDGSQVETDEIYIGIDKRGAHFVLPVQAKGGRDKIGIVQIEQDILMCEAKFPGLSCRPIAAQLVEKEVIALFEFEYVKDVVRISSEKHYRLVRPEELSPEELVGYYRRPE
jgi:hypothetical protein